MIEYFGVNKPSLVCCFEKWNVESSAEDLYVLDTYAPKNFHPWKTRTEGVSQYTSMSHSFKITEIDTGIDLNYIVISCTNLNKQKLM